MSPTAFELAPYPGAAVPAGARIQGTARRVGAILELEWRLQVPAEAIPALAARPERRRELWEATCCECFLRSPEHAGYWELNLSPAGHWNVFRFLGYRTGMMDEPAVSALACTITRDAAGCEVRVALDTTALGLAEVAWELAIATVLAEPGGRISYWALAHPGEQPDFHHPEAFQLPLASGR